MSMMGELSCFLGLHDEIFICQSKYIKDLLKKYRIKEASPAKALMPSEVKLDQDKSGKPVDITVSRYDWLSFVSYY